MAQILAGESDDQEMESSKAEAAEQPTVSSAAKSEGPGVFANLGVLPTGAPITESGLAGLLGKCTASVKAAVERGELPRPVRLMGKNTWTVGTIIRHLEARLENEAKKFTRLKI